MIPNPSISPRDSPISGAGLPPTPTVHVQGGPIVPMETEPSLRYTDIPAPDKPTSMMEKYSQRHLGKALSNKMFAHIHLSAQALKSGFEGMAMNEASNWAQLLFHQIEKGGGYLSDPKSVELLTPLIEGLHEETVSISKLQQNKPEEEIGTTTKEKQAIDEKALEWMHKIKSMQKGDKCILPTGWAGKPSGHAMYLQVEIDKEGLYNIFIYNAQGVKEQGSIEEEEKIKTKPLFVFKGLTKEDLFFSEDLEDNRFPDIFRGLLNLQILPVWHPGEKRYEFGLDDVLNVFHHVKHKRADPTEFMAHFMTAQRSGTCSQKSMNAMMLHVLNDTNAFKRVVFDSRLMSLINFYEVNAAHLDESTEEMAQVRYELRMAATHMVRKVEKYHCGTKKTHPHLSLEQAEELYMTFSYILNQVDKAETAAESQKLSTVSDFRVNKSPHLEQQIEKSYKRLTKFAKNAASNMAKEATVISTHPSTHPEGQIEPVALKSFLEKKMSTIKDLQLLGQSRHIAFEVESLLNSIAWPKKFPDNWWSKVPPKDQITALNLFSEFMEIYFDSLSVNGRPYLPGQQANGMALLAMVHQLTLLIDSNHPLRPLQDINLSVKGYIDVLNKDQYLTIKEPKEWGKRQRLMAYFDEVNKGKGEPVFDFGTMNHPGDDDARRDFLLYQSLAEKFPDIHQALQRKLSGAWRQKMESYEVPDQFVGLVPYMEDMGMKKRMTVQEITSARTSDSFSPLRSMGMDHLLFLKRASLMSSFFLGNGKESDQKGKLLITFMPKTILLEFNHYRTGLRIIKSEYHKLSQKAYNKETLESLDKAKLNEYLAHTKGGIKGLRDQNRHLLSEVKESYRKLVGTACEPRVLVSSLLSELTSNLSQIDTLEGRTLVDLLLFKPMAKQEGVNEFVPLFDDLKNQEEVTVDRVRKLITEGLKVNLHLATGEKPKLDQVFFLLGLAAHISEAVKWLNEHAIDPPLISAKDYEALEDYFNKLEAPDVENVARLRFHRLHSFLLSKHEDHSMDEWKTLFADWSYIQSAINNDKPEFFDPVLREQIITQMTWLESMLARHFQELSFRNAICNFVFSINVKEGKKVDLTWEPVEIRQGLSAPTLTFQARSPEGIWLMNLSTGKIGNENGIMKLGEHATASEHFSRLFGNRPHTLTNFGSTLYFEDKIHGEVRIVNGDYKEGIERKINGQWCRYVPIEKLRREENKIGIVAAPFALFGDFNHWVSLGSDHKPIQLFLTDQTTGKLSYVNDSSGLKPVLPDGSIGTQKLEYIAENEASFLSGFDSHEYIVVWERDNKRDHIQFTRFRDNTGGTLSFFRKDGDWIYGQDPNYRLEKPGSYSAIGNASHYLSLVHKDTGKRKLLIPNRRFESLGFLATSILKTIEKDDVRLEPQKQCFTYSEMSVVGDEVVSDNAQGNLNLANLFLAQKNYPLALHYLNKVTRSETITPEIREQLDFLLSSGVANKDYSADACAIRLKAWLLLKDLDPFAEDLKKLKNEPIKSPHQTIENVYRSYLEGLNTVASPIKLEPEQELRLLESLAGKEFKRRLHYLQQGSYPEGKEERYFMPDEARSAEPDRRLPIYLAMNSKILRTQEHIEESVLPHIQASSPFMDSYTTFKNGTPTEKRAKVYSMALTSKQQKKLFDDYYFLLDFVYKYPEEAPPPPPETANNLVRTDWILSVVDAFNNAVTNKKIPTDSGYQGFKEQLKPHELKKEILTVSKPSSIVVATPKMVSRSLPEYTPTREADGDAILATLESSFLTPKPDEKKIPISPPIDLSMAQKALSPEEKNYSEIINDELARCGNEIQEGRKRLSKEKPRPLIEGKETELLNELEDGIKAAKKEIHLAEIKIFHLINLPSEHPHKKFEETLKRVGRRERSVNLIEAIRASLTNDAAAYRKLCPNLKESQINELHQAVLDLMAMKTSLDHMDRVHDPLSKMLKLDKEIKESGVESIAGRLDFIRRERVSLARQVSVALADERHYVIKDDIPALYFEYVTGFRISDDQARILKQVTQDILEKGSEEEIGIVFQLIMGGGKTSVILSRLMELAAEKGYLPLFVAHHSQYVSAKGTLKKLQQERYAKNVIPIEYSSRELEKIEVLEHLYHTLQDTLKNKDMVLISSSTMQVLQLELLIQLRNKNSQVLGISTELINTRISWLQKINKLFLEKGIQMIDEVDLTLHILQMVNMPLGDKVGVQPERVALIRAIYESIASDKLRPMVHLQENGQKNLSKTAYTEKVAPKISKTIASSFGPLLLKDKPQFIESFVRFTQGKITPEIEKKALDRKFDPSDLPQAQKDDIAFLRYLHYTLREGDEKMKEASNLISLTAHLLQEVVPSTLSKEGNRSYGRATDGSGRVVPYLGVGAPATTEFGYIYELLCYHFQMAVSSTVEQGHLLRYAELMTDLANHYVEKGEKFNETAEAQEFEAFTGVRLADINKEGFVEKALAKINGSIQSKAQFEEMTALHLAKYYKDYLSATPVSLIDQTPKAVACSGTIHNALTYNQKMSTILPDEGAEGKILAEFLARGEKKKFPVQEVDSDELEPFLKKLLGSLPPDRAHALLEGGGLMKKYKAIEVSQGILDYYEKSGNKNIKGVVFLHSFPDRENPGMMKDSFALLTRDKGEPIPLANTSKDELTKHGLSLNELFVYYDELRNTGTDVPLPVDTIAPGTVDPSKPTRNLSQMLLRLRQFFGDQDVDIFVSTQSKELFVGNASTLENIVQTAAKASAIERAKHTLQSYQIQIDNFYRTQIIRRILDSSPDRACKIFDQFEPFLLSSFEDSPYEQHGSVRQNLSALSILSGKAKNSAELFKSCHSKNTKCLGNDNFVEMSSQAGGQVNELLEKAAGLKEFSVKVMYPSKDESMGLQVEFNLQLAVELQQNRELELSQELQNELEQYNFKPSATEFVELPWNPDKLDSLGNEGFSPRVTTVATWLSRGFGKKKYPVDYGVCFPPILKATENFMNTCNEVLPIFHKAQKSAEHILVRQNDQGTLEFILLSQKDAQFFKGLKRLPGKSWLMTPDKQPVSGNGPPLPKPSDTNFYDQLELGLSYIHLLNGDAAALDKNPFEAKRILSEGASEMKLRYLKLKAASNTRQRQILANSHLLAVEKGTGSATEIATLCSKRREKEEELRKTVAGLPAYKITAISPLLVHFVPLDKVCFLTTSTQIGQLTPEQLAMITPDQVDKLWLRQIPYIRDPKLIQRIHNPSHIEAFSLEQRDLATTTPLKLPDKPVNDISPDVVFLLSDKQLKKLKEPELIREVPRDRVNLLSKDAVPFLNASQIIMLSNPELIQEVSNERVNQLSDGAVEHLSDQQLFHLTDEFLIREVKPERVNHLGKVAVLFLTDKQMKHLTNNEIIPAVPLNRVNSLSEDAVPSLTPAQLSKLTDMKLVRKVRKDNRQFLSLKLQSLLFDEEVDAKEKIMRNKEEIAKLKARLQAYDVNIEPPIQTKKLSHEQLDKQFSAACREKIISVETIKSLVKQGALVTASDVDIMLQNLKNETNKVMLKTKLRELFSLLDTEPIKTASEIEKSTIRNKLIQARLDLAKQIK